MSASVGGQRVKLKGTKMGKGINPYFDGITTIAASATSLLSAFSLPYCLEAITGSIAR